MRKDFCVNCRAETEYEFREVIRREIIREKEYQFRFTTAVCKTCGEEMDIPGLIDRNIKERDVQYRETEHIVTVEEIEKLMEIYHIGKAPLSMALGFGEVTVSRYLSGQMPSRQYSDIMRQALRLPEYMEQLLKQNRDKVGETAYRKAMRAVAELKELFRMSDEMLVTIAYLFQKMREVTPLALQKILYFIQGIYLARFHKPMFPEECRAWVHGPVYETVYRLFRDFRYSPIEDDRFAILRGRSGELGEQEKQVVDLVVQTFGMYSGKALETITHVEQPWLKAREGCGLEAYSQAVVTKESMEEYFEEVSKTYGVDSAEGLNRYIRIRLGGTLPEEA
ncbi:MAG: DUF4065 domain-containing protein [Lachnospiraceae bacterium]|nr:DUF4065 domain-containing protein [Lachnospiraceae bacterium]